MIPVEVSSSTALAARACHLWLNERLKRHGLHCYDFVRDLADGELLYQLLLEEDASGIDAEKSSAAADQLKALQRNHGNRRTNLRALVQFLQNRGVFCGALLQMIPDMISRGEGSNEVDTTAQGDGADDDEAGGMEPILLLVWKVASYSFPVSLFLNAKYNFRFP